MLRPWYCHRIHGDVRRHENLDGTTVYSVRETPCDCVPPSLPPSPFPHHLAAEPTQAYLLPRQVSDVTHPSSILTGASQPFSFPTIPVVPPLSGELAQDPVAPIFPLPQPAKPDSVSPDLGPMGCTSSDHEIYKMCGFAFCPKCGVHTVPCARVLTDPAVCPLSHRLAPQQPIAAGEVDHGHRFCYLCGSSLVQPAAPQPEPAAVASPVPPTAPSPPATAAAAAADTVPAALGAGPPVQSDGLSGVGTLPSPPLVPFPRGPPTEQDINERGAEPVGGVGQAAEARHGGQQATHAAPPQPAPCRNWADGLSNGDLAVIDAVLDRLVENTQANGNVVTSPCGLPNCFLCRPPPLTIGTTAHASCACDPRLKGAWTGNAAVTIIHNHF